MIFFTSGHCYFQCENLDDASTYSMFQVLEFNLPPRSTGGNGAEPLLYALQLLLGYGCGILGSLHSLKA